MKKRIFIWLVVTTMTSPIFAEPGPSAIEPEIVIEQGEDATYYEHRVNGVLTEVKVVPKVGPVYYLVPADGGGWIKEEESQILVPKWKLFEW